jgi:tRNA-dihydrouridine synthase B
MDLATDEHPIGIQIFGHEPDVMAMAAQMAEKKGADFVDINMGCPVPKITKGKDGCALMREPDLAREIIATVKSHISIPLTIKFRLGWDDNSLNAIEFGEMAEANGASAVTVHGRTRQQLYSGRANWASIAKVKRALSIPVFGNGDVFEPEDALRLLEESGCDGVAVARGTLGNPWLVQRITKYIETGVLPEAPDDVERLIGAFKHCIGLIRYKGVRVGTNESRRHLTHYTKGIPNSAPFRSRLTQVASSSEVVDILAQLAEQVGGVEGKKRFLLGVDQDYLKYGKEPGTRYPEGESSIVAKINGYVIFPVAKPEDGTIERHMPPTHDAVH